MNIEDIREYCLQKRGVTEDMAFGPDMLLFRLCDKIFSCIDLSRPNMFVVKMDEERAIELREHYQGIKGAWHWNKRYWSDVYLDADVDDVLLRSFIDDAYEIIRTHLPKKTLYNFPNLPEGWKHEHFPILDSAMNVLRSPEMQKNKVPFLLVTSDFQTAGRGQGSNTWESEDKKNLLFAFRFFPTWIRAVDQFFLLQCISVAVAKTLEKYMKERVKIKWPNDIYIRDQKVCGILIEHTISGPYLAETRCGIGININQKVFHSSAPNPVSLAQLLGKEVDRAAVLRNFLKIFMEEYCKMKDDDRKPTYDYVLRLYRSSGWYPFKDKNGEFEARLGWVQDDGRLVLEDRKGECRTYAHKEVEFLLTKKEYTEY